MKQELQDALIQPVPRLGAQPPLLLLHVQQQAVCQRRDRALRRRDHIQGAAASDLGRGGRVARSLMGHIQGAAAIGLGRGGRVARSLRGHITDTAASFFMFEELYI